MSYTMDKMFKIWNDSTGERIEVGPDADGLDLLTIRSVDSDGKEASSVTLSKDEASLLIVALTELTK